MHVVIFTDYHDSTDGGVQSSVRAQRNALEQAGHRVTIVCPSPVAAVASDPNVITVPNTAFAPNGFPMAMPSLIREYIITRTLQKIPPVDIIHVQTNMGVGIMGVRIAKRLGIALVQTMHGRDDILIANTLPFAGLTMSILATGHRLFIPHRALMPKREGTRAAYQAWKVMVNHAQAADYVVMPSQHFVDKFQLRGLKRPTVVISNGLDDDMLKSLRRSTRRRRNSEPLRAMWCGRISPEKRPLICLEAIRELPTVHLDMYGEGSETEPIQRYIATHHLGDRVQLRGRASQVEIIEAMSDHDVLLYSSYGFDNQPMVMLEAVAAGLPVIYCDPDLTECMPIGGALLTKDALAGGFKDALGAIIADKSLLAGMQTVMQNSIGTVAQSVATKKMIDLYKQVVKSH